MRGQMVMLSGGPCDSRIMEVCDDWHTIWLLDWNATTPTRHEYVRVDEATFEFRRPDTDRLMVEFLLWEINESGVRERVFAAKGAELDGETA